MSEIELSDDLTDETDDVPESGEPAAPRRIPVGATVGLTLAVIVVACIVVLGAGRRPFSSRESGEVEVATATPTATATVQSTSVAAPATPIPAPAVIIVEGQGIYAAAEALPFVAEYSVSIANGDHVTTAVECAGCLWPDGFPVPEAVLAPETPLVFRVGVVPPSALHFSLVANGVPCMSWKLSPGNSTERFAGSCVPVR